MRTRALVLHPDIATERSRRAPQNALDEARSLALALPDLDVVGSAVVRLPKAQPGQLFGSGKVKELADRIRDDEIGLVLISQSASNWKAPQRQRNAGINRL